MTVRERVVRATALLGCGGLTAGLIGLAFVSGRRIVGVALVGAVGVLLVANLLRAYRRRALVREFRAAHPGKDLLVVYTDSPHWAAYIETRWLARWEDRVVALNRTRPWSTEQPAAKLWRAYAGSLEHTPVAIVIGDHGPVEVVRFWRAFRDRKHGRDGRLHNAESQLELALSQSRS